jgi:hypothetical protein
LLAYFSNWVIKNLTKKTYTLFDKSWKRIICKNQ